MAIVMNEMNATTIRVCPKCGREDDTGEVKCRIDGTALKRKDKLIGTTIEDKYEIISLLGRGGMSSVYKARHNLMDRIVAVKLLRDELVAIPQLVERFKRESKAIGELRHAGIVAVFDYGLMANGTPFLVMDYIEGVTLDKVIKQEGPLELSRAINLISIACDALNHSHSKGIVHRDIKPSNLLVRTESNGKETLTIFDFGIAKMLNQDGSTLHKLTTSGEIFGSPLYMSPEQAEGEKIDHRSDIYSLTCVVHEMILGEPPFRGGTPVETIMMHMNEEPRPFKEINPDIQVPEALEAAIIKCLSKSPNDRIQSTKELHDVIVEAATRAPEVVPQKPTALSGDLEVPGSNAAGASGLAASNLGSGQAGVNGTATSGTGNGADSPANTPRPSYRFDNEPQKSKSRVFVIAAIVIGFVGVCLGGLYFGITYFANNSSTVFHQPDATATSGNDSSNSATSGSDKASSDKGKDDPGTNTGTGVDTTNSDNGEKPATNLANKLEIKRIKQGERFKIFGDNSPDWSYSTEQKEFSVEAPPALLKKPDNTYVQGKRKVKCSVAVFDVVPAKVESEEAAKTVFKKYFKDNAESWNMLEVKLSRPYNELVVQEIQYKRAKDGRRVKQYLVYVREGGRLIASQFTPVHATQDEVLSTIDQFLPTLEGAVN